MFNIRFFYLQKTSPSILPSIDEIDSNLAKVDRDVTYRDYTKYFNILSPEITLDVTELWIGFLDYYLNFFDFEKYLTDIRRNYMIERLEDKISIIRKKKGDSRVEQRISAAN